MARKPQAPTIPPDDFPEEQELLPPAVTPEAGSATSEINLNIQRAEEQLIALKRQQEEIEQQKRELDELSRKRREFDDGRREIVEKLTRGLVLLEREEFEVKRELEQIKIVRDSFSEHLGQTENINPAAWSTEEMPNELTRALARVDQAKSIYSQSRARLMALRAAEEGQAEDFAPELTSGSGAGYEKTFSAMVREGFAYSIVPVTLLGLLLIVAYFLFHH